MHNTISANQAAGAPADPAPGTPVFSGSDTPPRFLIFAFQLLPGENQPDKLIVGETFFRPGKTAGGIAGNPIIAGKRRRRFTAFDLSTAPATLIRRDYSLEEIRAAGGKVPELYFDELGNMRGADDCLIMAGPGGAPGTFLNPATGAVMLK